MSLNKNYIFIFFLLLISSRAFAQESTVNEKDSTKIESLDKVVLTGQINPQSVKKSVFEVTIINKREIAQRAANNLADLLNQSLNINITPNVSTGKSGVSLFGLDGQYFKVLIDNVPVINEEGVGNNTDLTLINLDDIEKIEIVEGSMGVQYGANAVSGIINIITKKSAAENTKITIYSQEETVGNEYELFDQGRHIQSVKIAHNFTDDLFANVTYTRNDFGGFWDNRQGEVYDRNDGLRGHVWLPKEQHNAKLLIKVKPSNKFNIYYKFDYFNEQIDRFNNTVNPNENPATATSDPLALDEIYRNNRYIHNINANGIIGERANYSITASYQKQTKDLETYTYRIRNDQKLNVQEGEYLSRSAFFSRGTIGNLLKSNNFNFQLGYELTNERGSGSPLAITIDPAVSNVTQKLNNYDAFTSSEILVSDKFSLRPGARVSFSNLFSPQYVFSLSSKYNFDNGYELRTVLGSSNRTPSYDELYTYFVDINHDVQGNPALNPERGISAFVHFKKRYTFSENLSFKHKISASYLDVKDRIELIVVEQTPLAFQYNNIDAYKSFGVYADQTLEYKNFKAQLGLSVLGISKILDSNTNSNDDFLYNFQLNSNLSYAVPDWNGNFSLYFKHVGRQQQFVEKTNAQGNQEFVRGTTDAFSWFDVTFKKSFADNMFDATLGVRNLLDITSVNTNAFSGGAHNGPPTNLLLGYGRSYFLRLTYNLNL